MPSAKFVKSSTIGKSFRVEKVKGLFDLSDITEVSRSFDVQIPIEGKKWNIGLIVGSSGSGKTTIAKECFPDFLFFAGFEWSSPSMIEDFPASCSAEDITTACNYVGLSSAPDWLKPFSVLSNGQKMRAELARLFVTEDSKPVIYDEFTSVVDRQVAQVSSYAISKFIRKRNKQFVAVSCHRDIIDWLNPDWIYDTDECSFEWRSLRRRPDIQLCIREGKESEWQLFKNHHYLSGSHNSAARKFVAEINGVPVAWCSVLPFPHPKVKNVRRIHRLVARPDYQGLGIGIRLLEFVASYFKSRGYRPQIVSGLKYLVKVLSRSQKWAMARCGYVSPPSKTSSLRAQQKTNSCTRLTASFEYIGD